MTYQPKKNDLNKITNFLSNDSDTSERWDNANTFRALFNDDLLLMLRLLLIFHCSLERRQNRLISEIFDWHIDTLSSATAYISYRGKEVWRLLRCVWHMCAAPTQSLSHGLSAFSCLHRRKKGYWMCHSMLLVFFLMKSTNYCVVGF